MRIGWQEEIDTGKLRCIVIGAGPAGSATAAFLARKGHSVHLLDRRTHIEQKICGECLSPSSHPFLESLGIWSKIPASACRELEGITLVGPKGSKCDLSFGAPGMKARPFTIPRPVLDQALVDCALEAGVRVQLGTTITRLDRGFATSLVYTQTGQALEGDLLVGADGRHSWIARQLDLARSQKHPLRHSAIMGHFRKPRAALTGVEMHVTEWGYVGLNPLPNGNVNCIAVMRPERLSSQLRGKGKSALLPVLLEAILGENSTPRLRAKMEGSEPASQKTWSVSPLAWIPKKIIAPHSALVGDAAGFVDPFTGEGLYHALASAHQLVNSIDTHGITNGLSQYALWHQKTFGPEEVFCHSLQRLLPYSALADYGIRKLGEKSQLRNILAETVADRLPTRLVLSPWFWVKVLWP